MGSEVIGGWIHAFTKRNARVVFGVAVCLSRLLSIIGTRESTTEVMEASGKMEFIQNCGVESTKEVLEELEGNV
jgi:hypothetical protein